MTFVVLAVAGAVFGVERVTRWWNRRVERQARNDQIWERLHSGTRLSEEEFWRRIDE